MDAMAGHRRQDALKLRNVIRAIGRATIRHGKRDKGQDKKQHSETFDHDEVRHVQKRLGWVFCAVVERHPEIDKRCACPRQRHDHPCIL
jgi:hypothetical protein